MIENYLAHFIATRLGTPHFKTDGVDDAVADRFRLLREVSNPSFAPREDGDLGGLGFCYDGERCRPESLGWRFVQSYGAQEPHAIRQGLFDAQIAATYHDAASAEYHYRYEKDWGGES